MAKKKENSDALQVELISKEKIKILVKYPYASAIKIDDEKSFIAECENRFSEIESMRSELQLCENWQEDRDQYAGIVEEKDFPWENCSNLHIHITSMAVDILNTKAQAQMFVTPMMLLKPFPGQKGDDLYKDILLKEKYLDNKAQEEIEIEEKLDPVLQDAINLGTGIAKVSYQRRIDYDSTVSEIYEPTIDDIRKFKINFEKDKGTPIYNQYLKDLIGEGTEESPEGIQIEAWMTSDEVVYDNPEISYVKLDDLLVRPDIPNIEDHQYIGENVEFTWLSLCDNVQQKYFTNPNILKDLRAKYPREYHKKKYKAREVTTYYDYDKTDRPKRVVITYLIEEKMMLRAITFPYIHRKPCYVFFYIKRVPGSIYGEGLARRLKNTNIALNNLWNQSVDSGTLRNAPAFKAVKGSSFDPSTKKWFPAAIWWVGTITDVEALQVFGQSSEVLNMITRLERYGEWQTGVTAYASGRESASDPNAPASKAYMLLKESNLRLNKMIKQLHKGNKQVFMMIDKLLYQYTKRSTVPFMSTKGENIEIEPISKKVLGMKVNYIPQLSDITIDKEQQKAQDLSFGQYIMPLLAAVPTAQREILQIQIRNMGGAWEKAMDKLLPPKTPITNSNISTTPTVNQSITPTLPNPASVMGATK